MAWFVSRPVARRNKHEQSHLYLQALRAFLALVAGPADHHHDDHRFRGARQLPAARLQEGRVTAHPGGLDAGHAVGLHHLLAIHHRRMAAVHPLPEKCRGDDQVLHGRHLHQCTASVPQDDRSEAQPAATSRLSDLARLHLATDLGQRPVLPVLRRLGPPRHRPAPVSGNDRHAARAGRLHDHRLLLHPRLSDDHRPHCLRPHQGDDHRLGRSGRTRPSARHQGELRIYSGELHMKRTLISRKRLAGLVASLFIPLGAQATDAELLKKIEALTQQLEQLKTQVQASQKARKQARAAAGEIKEKVQKNEDRALDKWLTVGGDYQFRIDSLRGETKPFTDVQGTFQAAQYSAMTTGTPTLSSLMTFSQNMSAVQTYQQARAFMGNATNQAIMGGLNSYAASIPAYKPENATLYTNRFGLDLNAKATQDVSVTARLLMYKTFGANDDSA